MAELAKRSKSKQHFDSKCSQVLKTPAPRMEARESAAHSHKQNRIDRIRKSSTKPVSTAFGSRQRSPYRPHSEVVNRKTGGCGVNVTDHMCLAVLCLHIYCYTVSSVSVRETTSRRPNLGVGGIVEGLCVGRRRSIVADAGLYGVHCMGDPCCESRVN